MVSHSFTKICLFYSAGNFYSLKKTYYISDLAGIHKIMPKTSLILLIATLSLIGTPPFAGFISKFYIMMAAADQQNFFVMIILIFSSIFSFLYMSKIILAIYKPIKNKNNIEKKFLPISMFISLFLCISFVISFFFIQKIISIFLTFM
jgi:multicomponent Na+:H+ antiporter subunit D